MTRIYSASAGWRWNRQYTYGFLAYEVPADAARKLRARYRTLRKRGDSPGIARILAVAEMLPCAHTWVDNSRGRP